MSERSLRRNPSVLEQDLGDELLLYTAQGDAVHVLNATGRAVWRLCDGQHNVEDIAVRLRAAYAHTEERNVAAEAQQMVAALAERHLLVYS